MSYQFATINGTTIHYQAVGNGPALVLIHAGIAHLDMWDEQVAEFSQHFRVIRYDVRGWGKTPNPPGPYSDHGDLYALLQHLGVEKAIVLGISNGGKIAIDFCLAYQEMVSALIAVAPALSGFNYPSDERIIQKKEAAMEQAYKKGNIALAAELETQIWVDGPTRTPEQVDPEVRQKALQMVRYTLELPEEEDLGQRQPLEPSAAPRVSNISLPTLLIIGDKDVQAMFAVTDYLVEEILGAEKVIMPGTAHLPNMEQPARFNQIVFDFLAKMPV